jgi:hypothetical protein
MYYSDEGDSIHRFDVTTGQRLPDFHIVPNPVRHDCCWRPLDQLFCFHTSFLLLSFGMKAAVHIYQGHQWQKSCLYGRCK